MKISNRDLGTYITHMLQDRLELNLKFGCLDDIEVQFTREELTQITGARRIEDATVETMIAEIREAGFEVEGAGRSRIFRVRVAVRQRMTRIDSLEDLGDNNAFFEDLVMRYDPVVDGE